MTRFRRTRRVLIATIALAAVGFGLPAAAPVAVDAAGLRNCTELTGRDVDRVGCWELVWVDGVEVRMTFANVQFQGVVPEHRLGKFFVIGPQDPDNPQSLEAAFMHDHTVAVPPRRSAGSYMVHMRGILVLCSAEGFTTGACVPTLTGGLPLATTVNGQTLTSVEAIESVAQIGLVTLVDTGAVIVSTISGN